MAFRLGDDDGEEILSDINVTPLVDVMLVLLIIFMVAAPMLHQGIEVALPRASAQSLPLKVEDPLVLSIRDDGAIFLRDALVAREDLVSTVTAAVAARGDRSVFLKGDREVPYGQVVEVLDLLHQGGIDNVGLVTERPPRGKR